jgi:hypothetical protein
MKFLRISEKLFNKWFAVCVLYFLVHFAVSVVLDEITFFAPDEKTYLLTFQQVYSGNFSLEGVTGWPTDNVVFLVITYLPAKLLTLFGLSELQSLRLVSTFAGFFSMSLLYQSTGTLRILGIRQRNWLVLGFFIPSTILWTSLGLRESFIFLWLSMIFHFLMKFTKSRRLRHIIPLLIAIFGLAFTKVHIYVLLIIALIVSTILISLNRRKVNFRYLAVISLSLLPILVVPEIGRTVSSGFQMIIQKSVPQVSSPSPEIKLPIVRGQTENDFLKEYNNNPIFSLLVRNTGILERVKQSVEQAHLVSSSQNTISQEDKLNRTPASINNPEEVFTSILKFLFIPMMFVDNGSLFLNVLSYESMFWYPVYGFFMAAVCYLFKQRDSWNICNLTAVCFVFGFMIQSALVEINVGTAFRHRSVLLIGILILCAHLIERNGRPKPTSAAQKGA